MGKTIDMTGQKFGKLTVIEQAPRDRGDHTRWLCVCECSKTTIARTSNLRRGFTKSCGCAARGRTSRSSASELSTLYRVWANARMRCNNPKNPSYHRYGGRGIECRLDTYPVFRKWAYANGYKQGLTLDRVNNDGHYEYDNLRWTTTRENNRNKITTLLNHEKVRAIRDLRKLGYSYPKIARLFSVSNEAVRSVCVYRTWKDVI